MIGLNIGGNAVDSSSFSISAYPPGSQSGEEWKASYTIKDNETGTLVWSISGIDRAGNNIVLSGGEKIGSLDFNQYNQKYYEADTTEPLLSNLVFEETNAYNQAKLMINSGATIIDIGGESTRPGSKTIDEKDEWQRVKNTIIKLKKNFPKILLSLDTRKSYVMSNGIENGVDIINDVSGLNFDKRSFDLINSKKKPFILHHMQGTPATMQNNPTYEDVLLDIFDFFETKINFFTKKNYRKESIILDPGIGFGKNLDHNLRLMSKISIFYSLGCPILIGTSRKRFIEHIVTKFDTPDRTGGTLASVLYGLSQGVQLFRVHNVKEIHQGILVFNKILNTN